MMKIRLLSFLAICWFWAACSDEEALESSIIEKNWFAVEYDPNADELDQLRYKVYSEKGTAVFVNDTLGSEFRYDLEGKPYLFHKVYEVGYSFTYSGITSLDFTLLPDRTLLKEFLDQYLQVVYPAFGVSKLNPRGYLLVDTLLETKKFKRFYIDTYNSMLIMGMNDSNGVFYYDMNAEERVTFMKTLLLSLVYEYFVKFKSGIPEMKDFFNITINSVPEWPVGKQGSPYGKSFYPNNPKEDTLRNGKKMVFGDAKEYGFLSYGKTSNVGTVREFTSILSENDDFNGYLTMINTRVDRDIREEYKDWDLVLEKYEAMLHLLKTYKLDDFIKTKEE